MSEAEFELGRFKPNRFCPLLNCLFENLEKSRFNLESQYQEFTLNRYYTYNWLAGYYWTQRDIRPVIEKENLWYPQRASNVGAMYLEPHYASQHITATISASSASSDRRTVFHDYLKSI